MVTHSSLRINKVQYLIIFGLIMLSRFGKTKLPSPIHQKQQNIYKKLLRSEKTPGETLIMATHLRSKVAKNL